ncbi:MAG TPA: hypothetical protein VHE59_00650 [Mucilaginibacter sp.]|nr:hypothetical protein [Mucilaginibacter sp.]
MKKRLITKVSVLLLLAVYLFFHVVNSFFTHKHFIAGEPYFLLKKETSAVIQIQKPAKTIVSENRQSFKRYVQKASRYFILLLFLAISAAITYNFCHTKFYPLTGHPYLRFCVLRI